MEKTKTCVRFGIIGCGDIAGQEAQAIKLAKNAELVMAMDVKKEFAESLAKEHNIPYTTDLKEILERKDIDAVIISVPHFLHTKIAVESANAGKHIVMEKPIAVNLKEADQMIDVCKKNKVKLSVAFCCRYWPRHEKAKELIQKGVIGKIINITCLNMDYKPESYWTKGWANRVSTDWRASLSKSGGGILIMNVSHNTDWLYYITGLEVERVYAEYGTFATNVEVEDMISVTLRYKNGAVGCIEASSTAFGGGDNIERIYGTEGQIVLTDPLKVYVAKPVEGLTPNEWNEIKLKQLKDPWVEPRGIYMENFAESILKNKEVPVSPEDGRKSLEIIRAAYLSGKMHKPVTLPVKE